jgi:rRNA maturation endonuclease Nob1
MGIMKIIKQGEVPLFWYGRCKYCKSFFEYKRDENEQPPITGFKKTCPTCGKHIELYRIDTKTGENIKNSVPLSERENS